MSLPTARPVTDPTIRVQIPEGCGPGSRFNVRLDSGMQVQVTVPAGMHAGQFIDIIVPHESPASAPGGGGGGGGGEGTGEVRLSKAQVGLAGAGAVAGLVLAGPLTACALAGAGAYAASRDDATGATAKALGDRAFDMGKRAAAAAKAKAIEMAAHVAAEADRQRMLHSSSSSSGEPVPTVAAVVHR
jgi:hypothetical protein